MSKKSHVVEVGDRFETRDGRDAGRVVEVIAVLGLSDSAAKHIDQLIAKGDKGGLEHHIARLRARRTYVHVRTEAHPKNPDAVGNVSRVSLKTLAEKYQRVSR